MNDREGVNGDQTRIEPPKGSFLPGLFDAVALNCFARVNISDQASLCRIFNSYKQFIKRGDLFRLRESLELLEHWVFLAYDRRSWEAFDTMTNQWMPLCTIPCDESFNRADKESLAVGSELLVFGRELLDFAIWKYNVIFQGWDRCQGMNRPRCLFGSGSLGLFAIVAGGSDENGHVLQSAERYDSPSGKWIELPNMHTPRRSCSGFFMDGKFYVIGGLSDLAVPLTCGEEYNLETRRWRKIEDMYPFVNGGAAQAPPLVAVVDNQLFAVERLTNMVKNYNKVKNAWDELGRLPAWFDSSNGWSLAFKAWGKQLLVVGGLKGHQCEAVVLSPSCPASVVKNGTLDWKVLAIKEHVGVSVYNCAVMGC